MRNRGKFTSLPDAVQRLSIVVPVLIALIALLLYVNFNSVTDMVLTLSVIPMAMISGIFALFLTLTPFSISAAIGIIALFGISTMEGVLLLSYYNQLLDGGWARADAVWHAANVRMRPVMMTCVAACVGLLPAAAVSTGTGSQVQKPLDLVVVGGILLAPNLVLMVVPILIALVSRRKPAAATSVPAARIMARSEHT